MSEAAGKAVRPLPIEPNASINPHVMRELERLNNRINIQNETMQAMYNRLNPAAQFYDWVKETHPDILTQYTSIRELEEAGKERVVSSEMARAQVMGLAKYGNL